jgi:MFS family permease
MQISYGWVIVGARMIVTCVGFGAMFSLGVFLQPMSDTMGWSRTGISTAALLNFLCTGVGSFVWRALSDRLGTRAVVLLGGVLLGLGTVMASQVPTLAQFQVSFGMVVGFAAGSLYAPMTATTTRWFTRHRSLAVALVSAGLGLGSTTTAPQALRTPQLAAIAFTYFACCAAHSGPIFHMVTHVIDHGVPAMAAATVLSAAGLASLSGKIICGLVTDRLGVKRVLLAGLTLQALVMNLYLVTREIWHFYAVALVFGFAYGGVMPLYAIIVHDYFGGRIMGTTFGAVGFASTLGMALGPLAGGWMYDVLGSYVWLFIGSCGIGLGAVAIACTFRPPRSLPAALPAPSMAR